MLSRLFRLSFIGSVSIWVIGACGSSKSEGSEGAACYPNGTCDTGLACLSNTCVNPTSGAGGSGNGAGGSGNFPSVDLEACFACGDVACPSEKQACDDAPGCSEILECTVGCGDDITCKSQCSVSGLSADELTQAGLAMGAYTTCSALSCLSECSVQLGTGGGSAGTGASANSGGAENSGGASAGGSTSGGAGNTGGSPSGGAGNSTGGSTGTAAVMIFDGDGVGAGSEDHGIDGGFYILEDSVKDGELVADTLIHTDLDPLDSSAEPSDFTLSTAACVEGVVAVVTDADGYSCELNDADCVWGDLWGGGIGLSLKIVDEEAVAWDADAAGVTGFRFEVSGSIGGVPLRFMLEDTDGNQFCVNNVAVGSTVSVSLSSLKHNCWDPSNLALDRTKIKSISWQFVPDASSSYTISNFCVDSLYVLE